MTNQQLAETCRDILAEAKYQEEWLVAMANALLPCLEADTKYQIRSTNRQGWIDIDTEDLAVHHRDNMGYEMRKYFTAPPVPCLILPAQRPDFEKDDPVDIEWRGMCDGFNSCIEEVKRLNAPHTAHIEPSCATGRTMSRSEFNELVGKLAARMYGTSVDIADVLCAFNIKPERSA